jgi:malic enzyme
MHAGTERQVGQANNVFVFPGLGMGAIVSEARQISDSMVLAAARTLADLVAPERLATGALYPPIAALRSVSRAVALAVAGEAVGSGLSASSSDSLEAEIDAAMWWPDYVPYLPG